MRTLVKEVCRPVNIDYQRVDCTHSGHTKPNCHTLNIAVLSPSRNAPFASSPRFPADETFHQTVDAEPLQRLLSVKAEDQDKTDLPP